MITILSARGMLDLLVVQVMKPYIQQLISTLPTAIKSHTLASRRDLVPPNEYDFEGLHGRNGRKDHRFTPVDR